MLSQMNLRDVLEHLKSMARRGFLEDEEHAVAKELVSVVDAALGMKASKLQPAEIYLAYWCC